MRSSDWNERPGNGVCRRPPHHFVCGDQWCWWRIRTRRSKGEWIPAQAAVGKSEAEGNKRQLRLVGQILRSHPRNATPSPYSTRTRTFPRNTLPHITHSLGTISQNMFKCNEPAVPSGKPTPFFLFTPPPPPTTFSSAPAAPGTAPTATTVTPTTTSLSCPRGPRYLGGTCVPYTLYPSPIAPQYPIPLPAQKGCGSSRVAILPSAFLKSCLRSPDPSPSVCCIAVDVWAWSVAGF
mmetsp:Transcript_79585/g.133314  ORF Transcript_79585/g.133314 Transcript_79585/m.133314 type:complete len:236 (+) Transcript_79585:1709-2416(+)